MTPLEQLEAYAAELVADWPPLTAEQREHLALLLDERVTRSRVANALHVA